MDNKRLAAELIRIAATMVAVKWTPESLASGLEESIVSWVKKKKPELVESLGFLPELQDLLMKGRLKEALDLIDKNHQVKPFLGWYVRMIKQIMNEGEKARKLKEREEKLSKLPATDRRVIKMNLMAAKRRHKYGGGQYTWEVQTGEEGGQKSGLIPAGGHEDWGGDIEPWSVLLNQILPGESADVMVSEKADDGDGLIENISVFVGLDGKVEIREQFA